jgi:hypothetical protein
MELSRMVASRLEVPDSVFEARITAPQAGGSRAATGQGAGAGAPAERPGGAQGSGQGFAAGARAGNGAAAGRPLSRRIDTERAFLALCIAAPEEGSQALGGPDTEELFSTELLRRAAAHLRLVGLEQPMSQGAGEEGGPEHDEDLRNLLAELIVQAGAERPNPAMLEVQRLQLELARLERGIQSARGQEDRDVSAMAQRRKTLKAEFDRAYALVLEQTGERES